MRVTWLRLLALALLLALAASCGAPTAAQPEEPTPTPLPTDTALERETYTVRRGPIDRVLEINGRVSPVDLVQVSFKREGRVERVAVKRGDAVKAGAVLAELQQSEQIEALRDAEDALVQAQRDVENERKQQAKAIKQAEIELQQAKEDLQRLLPGGEDDPIRKAQKELLEAQRAAKSEGDSASEAKTGAEYDLLKSAEALQDAQKAYSKAWWDNDWVERYGTDPHQTEPISGTDQIRHVEITEEGRESYRTKLVEAERAMREAERGVAQAQRKLDQMRGDEIVKNDEATEKVREAQRKLDALMNGSGNKELIAAQRAVESKQLALEEAREGSFNAQLKAVETAQRAVEKARKKVEDGRVTAPQDGEVVALNIGEGDTVEAFSPVVEIADLSRLEVAAELGGDQMRQLQEGQPVEISLLARPDVVMPASIRLMPAPYGSGSSGTVETRDRRTHFEISDTKGQELTPGAVAKIRIVLEHKDDVLLLPPEAVRAFEGRRFVVVREGDRERRVTVKVGIETEEAVEITEGLKAGDVIVGQ